MEIPLQTNSYHTDHIAIGLKTHKVVDIQHVNRDGNGCTQRHKAAGFYRKYSSLDPSNIKVAHHVHDRIMWENKHGFQTTAGTAAVLLQLV